MATTRKELRQRLGSAAYLGDTTTSTTSATAAPSTTTFVDTTNVSADDTLNNAWVVITSGAAAGDIRLVTDWANATGTGTVERAFTGAVIQGIPYELHRVISPNEKNDALQEAQRLAKDRWPRRIEDTSLTLTANTYTYSLAALTVPVNRFTGIEKVEYDTGDTATGAPYALLDDDYWYLRDANGTLTLQLKVLPDTSRTIRLTYQVRPTLLTTDSVSLDPDVPEYQNYLCAKAASICARTAGARAGQGMRDHWMQLAERWEQAAEGLLVSDRPAKAPGKVRFARIADTDGGYNSDVTRVRLSDW